MERTSCLQQQNAAQLPSLDEPLEGSIRSKRKVIGHVGHEVVTDIKGGAAALEPAVGRVLIELAAVETLAQRVVIERLAVGIVGGEGQTP